jgi:hypothetical protein
LKDLLPMLSSLLQGWCSAVPCDYCCIGFVSEGMILLSLFQDIWITSQTIHGMFNDLSLSENWTNDICSIIHHFTSRDVMNTMTTLAS